MVHSVESPRPAKSAPFHVDTDVTKGSLEDSRPLQRLSCRRAANPGGLLTPHQPQKPPLLFWHSFLWGRLPTLSIYSPIPHITERKGISSEAHRTAVPSGSQCLYEHIAALSALQNEGQLNMTWKYPPNHLVKNQTMYIAHGTANK